MQKKTLIAPCALLTVIGWLTFANAATIVDTGPGPSYGGGWSLGRDQWLAVQFAIDSRWRLTDIYGWIKTQNVGGVGHITLYEDQGGLPGDQLFSVGFVVAGSGYNWWGANSLDWPLERGTYWASFEVRDGDSLSGVMSHPSQFPVEKEASWQHLISGHEGWFEANGLDIGVRINGTENSVVPVPEPGSLLLGTTGVLGVLAARAWCSKRDSGKDVSGTWRRGSCKASRG